jgi:hypothetical protein
VVMGSRRQELFRPPWYRTGAGTRTGAYASTQNMYFTGTAVACGNRLLRPEAGYGMKAAAHRGLEVGIWQRICDNQESKREWADIRQRDWTKIGTASNGRSSPTVANDFLSQLVKQFCFV